MNAKKHLKPIAAAALALVCAGCIYRGAKVTEGTNLAVGLTVPSTEGMVQINALDYVSGFRMGVAENARLEVRYTAAQTNAYFGCIRTVSYKTIDAAVVPCASNAVDVAEAAPIAAAATNAVATATATTAK